MLKLARVLSLVCLLVLPAIGLAQTRPRTTTRRPTTNRRTTPRQPTALGATALNEARLRVAEKIKVLTKFLYLYARTSKELEATEAQARAAGQGSTAGQASAQLQATLERNRAQLRANLQNVRAGLDELELYFKTTPAAGRYYQSIAGVAATAADAENRVTAGQLDAAGRALLEVVGRLTDVLLEMP